MNSNYMIFVTVRVNDMMNAVQKSVEVKNVEDLRKALDAVLESYIKASNAKK